MTDFIELMTIFDIVFDIFFFTCPAFPARICWHQFLGVLMKRRDFVKGSILAGGGVLCGSAHQAATLKAANGLQGPLPSVPASKNPLPDLTPARWIWYPSERTPQNTFVLFRRPLDLPGKPFCPAVRVNWWSSSGKT